MIDVLRQFSASNALIGKPFECVECDKISRGKWEHKKTATTHIPHHSLSARETNAPGSSDKIVFISERRRLRVKIARHARASRVVHACTARTASPAPANFSTAGQRGRGSPTPKTPPTAIVRRPPGPPQRATWPHWRALAVAPPTT